MIIKRSSPKRCTMFNWNVIQENFRNCTVNFAGGWVYKLNNLILHYNFTTISVPLRLKYLIVPKE